MIVNFLMPDALKMNLMVVRKNSAVFMPLKHSIRAVKRQLTGRIRICAVFMPLKYSIRAEKRHPGGSTRQSERSSEQPTDYFIFSLEKSAQ